MWVVEIFERELEPIGEIKQWEGRYENDLFEVYYRKFQKTQNPKRSLIALHGTTSHGGTFKQVIAPLMEVYDLIITPDIPGNGKSKIKRRASVEEYADALEEFITPLPGKVIYAHSGHAAIGVELYNRFDDSILILAGPTYTPQQTFLGRFGGPIVELIGHLPSKINLPEIVKSAYATFFAHKHEKEIQKKRKIKMDNKALYWDVKAAEEYFKNNRPLLKDPSRAAILRFERDPLSKLSKEELENIHGGAWVIDTGYKGHHLQKGDPEKLVEFHKQILNQYKQLI